jgi:hypothetical protein
MNLVAVEDAVAAHWRLFQGTEIVYHKGGQSTNDGDQVLLLDAALRPADVLVYGDAVYPGVALFTHSLERYPACFDTDDCSLDFRDWPFPNPGQLPLPDR